MEKKPIKGIEKKILAQNPDPKKQGVNISEARYQVMKDTIIAALEIHGALTFQELARSVEAQLEGKFDGSILWYMTTTKLDLEARKVIERVPGTRPHKVQLVK
jgi:hypothetical protein